MDKRVLDYLMDKMDSSRGDSRNYNRDSRKNDLADMKSGQDYRRDGSGRGTVDFEGSMDFNDSNRPESWGNDGRYDSRDYRDYRNSRDYHHIRLTKSDIHRWKLKMENEDGTRGPHYDMQQVMSVADKMGIKFDEFDEREFCIAVNMMYSDYCKVAKKYVSPDKELMFFAELAKAFLDDEDGPEASDKLAIYFHCIVDA